jgi:integrase
VISIRPLLGRLKAGEIARLGLGRYHDGGGLYLIVGKGEARSWIFHFRRNGKLHDYGLGPVHSVGLAAARQRAFECRAALYAGNNPVEMRQAKRLERMLAAAKAMSFEHAAEQYITAQAPGWCGPRQEQQWRQSLIDSAFPILGRLPVMAIDTPLVLQVLEPIWQTKTETASRLCNRIEAVLNWATSRGFRQGENSARWKGHLENLLAQRSKVQRVVQYPALPYSEIRAFTLDLRQHEGVAARALECLILTACRTNEVRHALWDEIDIGERVWTVPAERMKPGRDHRVPLSDAAMQVLGVMSKLRIDDYVFRGRNGALGHNAMLRVLASFGRNDISVHGFRITFRDWAAKVTAHPKVVEMALSHVVKNQAEAAYRRGDLFEKRRALMPDWAQRCASGAAVLPLPGRLTA